MRDVRPRLPRQGDAGEAHELPRRGEATRVPRVRKEVRQGDSIYRFHYLSKPSERSERGLGSEEISGRSSLIDSEMAGRIRLKLGGMVEGMGENVLAKEFFGSVEVDRGQVSGPQVPLLGHGDDKETQNWA